MSDNSIENKPLSKPNKYYLSAQARRAHVRAYESSNDSMPEYCKKHHLSLIAFKIWVSRYGERKLSATFIPVTLSQKNEMVEIEKHKTAIQRLEITIGSIKITCPEITDIEIVIKLIQGLSYANKTQCADGVVLQ